MHQKKDVYSDFKVYLFANEIKLLGKPIKILLSYNIVAIEEMNNYNENQQVSNEFQAPINSSKIRIYLCTSYFVSIKTKIFVVR